MTLPPLLTRLIAAVIVMIAAAFGASMAQAHEGHTHHAAQAATAHHHPRLAPEAVAPRAVAETFTKAAVASPADRLLSVAVSRAKTTDERLCNGVCCSLGASCCVPGAMLPAAAAAFPAATAAVRLIAAAEPFRAGIAREALPKPPRSIA
ncbi:hypothetical protein [Methylobacterium isbiliense]|jgi:hypothetical protein|uniref:Cobalt-zinc-cadmium resistance protein CzcI n=1 Tax=Methylobacterium isbiliense TaxID=315478 RepID=A0ABQ4S6I0_9HYPH|nr:hypothetical protein [Methylobacterium isbiliense]MDN3625769.1 hypothetical protein [Methylobacterium isbiliense]GJD98750.1 hypothetical protein GMJLKIPL_0661 [Methylobacterium isbiliense]